MCKYLSMCVSVSMSVSLFVCVYVYVCLFVYLSALCVMYCLFYVVERYFSIPISSSSLIINF